MLSYGCWCNFYADRHHVAKGLGRPLDGIDLACHHWQQCHQCTKMDDMDCVPLLVEYDLSITATKNSYGLINQKVSCEGSESGCAKWNCQCDANFAEQIVELVARGQFDAANSHSSEDFDSSRVCEWNGVYETHDECCGDYPKRFPFSTDYGNRACCVAKTFNLAEGVCCQDGSISSNQRSIQ